LKAVLDQHEDVVESLTDMSQARNGEIATKASGVLDGLCQGETLLLLSIALAVFSLL